MGRLNRGANKNVTSMFGGAQTAQLQTQLHQRDEEIAALKEQLESIKVTAASTEAAIERYALDQFIPLRLPQGLTQPRKYFDPKGMEKLRRSIAKVGVQEPLLVRPSPDGKLEIVSGERRWRSALELQLAELPAIPKELSDEEALEIALVANLMREDLNPVEESDSIVALIALRLRLDRQHLSSVLFKIKNLRTRRQLSNQEIAQELQDTAENSEILTAESIGDVDAILSEFSISLESFVANRLTALEKMPEPLLEAVRSGQIEFSKADVIRRSDLPSDQQAHLLTEAIDTGLTKQALMDRVQGLKAEVAAVKEPQAVDLRTQVHQDYQKLRSKRVWSKLEKSPKLRKKAERVAQLIGELLADIESSR
jgi:ParB family chromosome partitioning protein